MMAGTPRRSLFARQDAHENRVNNSKRSILYLFGPEVSSSRLLEILLYVRARACRCSYRLLACMSGCRNPNVAISSCLDKTLEEYLNIV